MIVSAAIWAFSRSTSGRTLDAAHSDEVLATNCIAVICLKIYGGKNSAWIVFFRLCYKVELKCNNNATTTTNGLHKRCTTQKNYPGESHMPN